MRTFRKTKGAVNTTPTDTKEDYLRAIYRFEEKNGGAEKTVRLASVAGELGLSKSTVSERVKELKKLGLIKKDDYAPLSLTPKGRLLARKLTHKHRVIEVFLHDVLNIPLGEVHAEAHRLEHAVSDKVITRLGTFLKHPTHDSHGTPIPPLD